MKYYFSCNYHYIYTSPHTIHTLHCLKLHILKTIQQKFFFHVSPYVPDTFQHKVTPHMQGAGLRFYIAVSVLIQKQAYC